MKKVIFTIVAVLLVIGAGAQSITKRKALKTYLMGHLRLEQVISEKDTLYGLYINSGNRYEGYYPVALGDRQNAIRLLKLMEDVKLEDDDILYLENQTKNRVSRGFMGSLRIYSESGVFHQDFDPKYMRKCREVLESLDADGNEEKPKSNEQRMSSNSHSAQE